jgi:hypothetical protein
MPVIQTLFPCRCQRHTCLIIPRRHLQNYPSH